MAQSPGVQVPHYQHDYYCCYSPETWAHNTLFSAAKIPTSPSLTKAHLYIWNCGSRSAGRAAAWSSSLHTPRYTPDMHIVSYIVTIPSLPSHAGELAVVCRPSPGPAAAAATQVLSSCDSRATWALGGYKYITRYYRTLGYMSPSVSWVTKYKRISVKSKFNPMKVISNYSNPTWTLVSPCWAHAPCQRTQPPSQWWWLATGRSHAQLQKHDTRL